MADPKRPIRCAIYTRKSTEYGLEQDFNSLDAQREAGEAYIKSQAHEGWVLLPARYDDGGISGATLDRPAVQALLNDVKARRIDVVVVYKVDRLTRSLADFAKLVELFDAHGVSFVSVTQQFNTTTSMGRLTLNVLLSFAQFEREVTAERIRDKIAASKQKGIWVGGPVPLGYAVQDKKLVIVEDEAEKVRLIFDRYLELKSLLKLQRDLHARGIVSKKRVYTSGRTVGGTPYMVGGLTHLLKNRMYLGELNHKGKSYPGEHPPIIDRETFDAVQAQFAENAVTRKRKQIGSGALLIGKLYDDAGNRMSPMHCQKHQGATRYRYYVSRPLLKGRKRPVGLIPRVPAPDIERAIVERLREVWRERQAQSDVAMPEDHALIEMLHKTVLTRGRIDVTLTPADNSLVPTSGIEIVVPFEVRATKPRKDRIASGAVEELDNDLAKKMRSNKRKRLVLAVAKARSWVEELSSGKVESVTVIAEREGVSTRHIRQTIQLAFLAPEIVQAILQDQIPAQMGVSEFIDRVPTVWREQGEAGCEVGDKAI